MKEEPPVRLLDDPAVAVQLRRDMRAAREHPPLDYDVASGLARLRAASTAPGAQPGGEHGSAARAGTSASTGVIKGWGLAVVGLSALGAAWLLTTTPASPPPVEHSRRAPPAAVAPASEARASDLRGRVGKTSSPMESATVAPAKEAPGADARPAPLSKPRAADMARAPAHEGARKRATRQAKATSPTAQARSATAQGSGNRAAPSAETRKLREIRQLAQARRALGDNPALALRLAREGQHEFRDGMFVQERSALTVFALSALGRHSEARSAAEAHLQRYREGPFAARVQRILEAAQ